MPDGVPPFTTKFPVASPCEFTTAFELLPAPGIEKVTVPDGGVGETCAETWMAWLLALNVIVTSLVVVVVGVGGCSPVIVTLKTVLPKMSPMLNESVEPPAVLR